MKNHRGKMMALLLVCCLFLVSFFLGQEENEKTQAPVPPSLPASQAGDKLAVFAPLPGAENGEEGTFLQEEKDITTPSGSAQPDVVKPALYGAQPENEAIVKNDDGIAAPEGVYTCTLRVHCEMLLENNRLLAEKRELVPADGVIFQDAQVSFTEGETVFDILQREMKEAKIPMEFVRAPGGGFAYVEGIQNLYEYDCGELSGWMYKVNDWFPNYSSSQHVLKEGDIVEWVYTCDLGRDIGGEYSGGMQ